MGAIMLHLDSRDFTKVTGSITGHYSSLWPNATTFDQLQRGHHRVARLSQYIFKQTPNMTCILIPGIIYGKCNTIPQFFQYIGGIQQYFSEILKYSSYCAFIYQLVISQLKALPHYNGGALSSFLIKKIDINFPIKNEIGP